MIVIRVNRVMRHTVAKEGHACWVVLSLGDFRTGTLQGIAWLSYKS